MRDQPTDRAAAIGRTNGTAAAQSAFDGNTSGETYRRVLKGIEDGDPEILDAYHTPDLSGDYTERDLIADRGLDPVEAPIADVSAACDAYLDAADEAFWSEIERIARDHAESGKIVTLQAAGFPVTYVDRADAADGTVPPYGHYHHRAPAPGLAAYVDLRDVARDDDGSQTTTVDRSNYRSLMDDYPDAFTPISYTNMNVLGAFVSDLTDELTHTLAGLRDEHPVYDEADLETLESDEITQSWDQYASADIASMIYDHGDTTDAWDALTADQQRDLFWQVCVALDIYPEHDGREIHWAKHYPAIVAEITGRLTA